MHACTSELLRTLCSILQLLYIWYCHNFLCMHVQVNFCERSVAFYSFCTSGIIITFPRSLTQASFTDAQRIVPSRPLPVRMCINTRLNSSTKLYENIYLCSCTSTIILFFPIFGISLAKQV